MKEKKLTDEEIVKALECCSSGQTGEACKKCPLRGICVCNSNAIEVYALDLIHRLQSEIETLKSNKFASWKVKFFKAQEEIERLTEENSQLESSAACERVVNRQMKAMLDNFHECDKLLRKENAELQKQVDELTDKLGKVLLGIKADEVLVAKGIEKAVEEQIEDMCLDCPYKLKFIEIEKQAVKDTAKEIYLWLREKDKRGMTVPFNTVLRQLKERFGVEVEE